MSVKNKFIHFSNWAKAIEYLSKKDNTIVDETTARAFLAKKDNNDLYYWTCFIKESKEIYTHGQFYDCSGCDDIQDRIAELKNSLDTKVDLSTYDILVSEVEENESVTAAALVDLDSRINSAVSDINDINTEIDGLYPMIEDKQPKLECGKTIKTINNECILGSGNITIETPDHKKNEATKIGSGIVDDVTFNDAGHITTVSKRSLTSTDIPALDASKITSGTISIERLPAGALERMFVVASEAAAMSSADVQDGDVVQITGNSNKMYFCVDYTATTFASRFREFTAGTATSVPWSGVTDKPDLVTQDELDVVNDKFENYLPIDGEAKSALKMTPEYLTDLNAATRWRFFDMKEGYGSTDGNKPNISWVSGITGTVAAATNYRWQFAVSSESNRPFFRREHGGTWRSWESFALTSDIPTKLSQLTDDVVAGKYLPLSGTAADSSKFGGMLPRYYLSAQSGDFTDFNGAHWNTIYEYRKGDGISYDNDPLGQGWAAFISLRSNKGTDGLQFLAQHYAGTNKLLYRCKPRLSDVGQSNEWSEIANLNSNVASATKLKTSRKIWGQSFDGTGDIDGNITINGGIATYNSADECWEFSGKIKANDFVTNTSEVVVNQFKLSTTLNNSIINYQSDVVSSPFMAIIKPVPGFDLSNITITMGGEDISYANESNGVIIIPDVTGDINIVANSTVNTPSYVGDDNDITLELPSGEYTLVYEDANGNQIDNFDEITTLNI